MLIQLRAATDKDKPKRLHRVSISRRQPPAQPTADTTTQIDRQVAPPVEPTPQPVILIVDDTPTNLQILFGFLEQAGYRVLVCQNGENALSIAARQQPDLILLDVLMPGIDGFETCHRLKADPRTAEIPIIFLTALSETAHKVRGFEVGGVDYVTKPIQQPELLARIKTHLHLQQAQRKLIDRNRQLQLEVDRRQEIEAQLRDRTQELQQALIFEAILGQITDKIRDTFDETDILDIIARSLVDTLQLDRCQIEFYDSTHTAATIAYEYSPSLSTQVGNSRKIDDLPDLYADLLAAQSRQFPDTDSASFTAAVPIIRLVCPIFEGQSGDTRIGNIWLSSTKRELFTDREIEFAQQLASDCAIAIRQARLYAAAQSQIEELERLDRIKDRFLKTIAHELRSPMTRIKIGAQTLKKIVESQARENLPANFDRVLHIFQQACDRQNELVDDLLSIAYLDTHAQEIVFEDLDLGDVLATIGERFRDIIADNDQKLLLDLPTAPIIYATDIEVIDRILTELITNACKYTPSGETIALKVSRTQSNIAIAITNTGVEIPAPEIPRIFEQFYRIPSHDPWQHGGTGLGLALVKKLVELLEAEISVTSQDLQTTFAIVWSL
jgi:signal transduction histidine kinase